MKNFLFLNSIFAHLKHSFAAAILSAQDSMKSLKGCVSLSKYRIHTSLKVPFDSYQFIWKFFIFQTDFILKNSFKINRMRTQKWICLIKCNFFYKDLKQVLLVGGGGKLQFNK